MITRFLPPPFPEILRTLPRVVVPPGIFLPRTREVDVKRYLSTSPRSSLKPDCVSLLLSNVFLERRSHRRRAFRALSVPCEQSALYILGINRFCRLRDSSIARSPRWGFRIARSTSELSKYASPSKLEDIALFSAEGLFSVRAYFNAADLPLISARFNSFLLFRDHHRGSIISLSLSLSFCLFRPHPCRGRPRSCIVRVPIL